MAIARLRGIETQGHRVRLGLGLGYDDNAKSGFVSLTLRNIRTPARERTLPEPREKFGENRRRDLIDGVMSD